MKQTHLIILFALLGTLSCKQNPPVSDAKQPNIIFIMADDLGYGDLGCYGQTIIKTPNIDKLAAQGMRFTQCYSGSTVCAPARSVIMTGRHTGHTTVRGNFGIGGVTGLGGGEGRVPLAETDTTVAQVLKQAGYITAMVGKWGLGEPGTSGEPNRKGFDEFYGFLNQRRAHTYFPDYIWKDTSRIELPGNVYSQQKEYTHDLFAQYSIDFIKRNFNKPFFLYLPFCLPHNEYEIPDYGLYEGEEWSDDLKSYAAMITRLDKTVGQIVTTLKEVGIEENTYIFFTSDNGSTNIHDEWDMFKSNAPFRGRKRDAYEGGIRVPMIVYNPVHVNAGESNDLVWYFADVLPTLAEIAQVNPPENIDGMSVLPAILGENQHLGERYLYWEFYAKTGWRAVRFGNWKAIQYDMNKEIRQPIELYDLIKDIGETDNVAAQYPEIIDRVESMFEEAHTPSPNFVWDYLIESE